MKVFVSKDGKQYGPYTVKQLREYARHGHFSMSDYACFDGQNWMEISQVPGFDDNCLPPLPSQQPQSLTRQPKTSSSQLKRLLSVLRKGMEKTKKKISEADFGWPPANPVEVAVEANPLLEDQYGKSEALEKKPAYASSPPPLNTAIPNTYGSPLNTAIPNTYGCSDCGGKISPSAITCPHCGKKLKMDSFESYHTWTTCGSCLGCLGLLVLFFLVIFIINGALN
jgi:hypothetical protein